MATNVKQSAKPIGNKSVAILTLVVLLVLGVAFTTLGFTGMKMDPIGLHKFLPFMPTPRASGEWKQALPAGADLGTTLRQHYNVSGEALKEGEMDQTLKILGKRMAEMGWHDATVEQNASGFIEVVLPEAISAQEAQLVLSTKGVFGFADPEGKVFLTGDHIVRVRVGLGDQTGKSYALSFDFDAEGKKILAEKTQELIGKSIGLQMDGVDIVKPSIKDALTEGSASIPGFTLEQARTYAVLMRSGTLPQALTLQESLPGGEPVLGARVAENLVLFLDIAALLIALYFIVTYRFAGLLASFVLLMQLVFSFFFIALGGLGFTLSSLCAVYAAFGVMVLSLLALYGRIREDLVHGRSMKLAVKDAYRNDGHIGLDITASLLILSVILIIMDNGVIGFFARSLAMAILSALVLSQIGLRVALYESAVLLGDKTFHVSKITKGKEEKA